MLLACSYLGFDTLKITMLNYEVHANHFSTIASKKKLEETIASRVADPRLNPWLFTYCNEDAVEVKQKPL